MTTSAVRTLRMVVNRRALDRACARAAAAGVERGGIYDVRASALVVWGTPGRRDAAEPIGMISWHQGEPAPAFATIHRVEAGEGHTPEEILAHLRRLLDPTPAVAPGDEYG